MNDSTSHRIDELSWDRLQSRLKETDAVLVPIGCIEPHGRHAPVALDGFVAEEIASRLAGRSGALIFPTLHLGTLNALDFPHSPGGVPVEQELLIALYANVGTNLGKVGFRRIVFVNAHGNNTHALAIAAYKIRDASHAEVGVLEWWSGAGQVIAEIKGYNYANHADRIETSLLLATPKGSLVDLKAAVVNSPTLAAVDPVEKDLYLKKIPYTRRFDERWMGTSGNMGDPTSATAEDGNRIIEATVDTGVKLLEVLHNYLSVE